MKHIISKVLNFHCFSMFINKCESSGQCPESSNGHNLLLSYVSTQYTGSRRPVFLTVNLIPTCYKNFDVFFWQFLPHHAATYVNKLFLWLQWQITLFPKPKCTLLYVTVVGGWPKSKTGFTNVLCKPSNNFCFSLNSPYHFSELKENVWEYLSYKDQFKLLLSTCDLIMKSPFLYSFK